METIITTWNRTESLRGSIIWFFVEKLMPVYIWMRSQRKSWDVTREDLAAMPQGSLGNDIGRFLEQYNLDIMPKLEFHDAYHVLFAMESNRMYHEMCMQFVVMGNGKFSLPYYGALFLSIILFPEYWEDFYAAWKMGRNAIRFHDLDLEQLLEKQTSDLRRLIFLHPDA